MTTATPSTTRYPRGSVVLLAFPFTTGTSAKNRPALVLLDTGDKVQAGIIPAC